MRTLWLPPSTRLFADKAVRQVSELAAQPGAHVVVDDFGDEFTFDVEETPVETEAVVVTLSSGTPLVVGADSVVNVIVDGKARLAPIKANALTVGQYLYMPKRKLRLSAGTAGDEGDGIRLAPDGSDENTGYILREASERLRTGFLMARVEAYEPKFRGDRTGLFLEAADVTMLRLQLILAGHYGMTAVATPGDLRVSIDTRRPSCFPSKLTSGLFHQDKQVALQVVEDFYGRGIFRLAQKLTDRFLEKVWRHGIVFEGAPVENLVKVSYVSKGKRPVKMLRVNTETADTPVETTYATL